ncbi:Hypp1596 [Branchiostoma lanceolatum]|uniref:Hypp1596 protein n=1 Tax=Branchiostoma lanceolatum TaxID=7740 RepID=A0A8K0EJI5_BRALA|nr:Hypp1596 [Branchiostoma lanceolatum]
MTLRLVICEEVTEKSSPICLAGREDNKPGSAGCWHVCPAVRLFVSSLTLLAERMFSTSAGVSGSVWPVTASCGPQVASTRLHHGSMWRAGSLYQAPEGAEKSRDKPN